MKSYFLLLLFVSLGCASTPAGKEAPAPVEKTPLYDEAKRFNDLLFAATFEPDLKQWQTECKRKSTIFCSSLQHIKSWRKLLVKVPSKPVPVKKPPPYTLQFKGDQPLNWNTIRRQNARSLITSIADLEDKKLQELKTRSLAETKCPNFIAVAVAATLEEHLPKGVDAKTLAALYEKGGRCLKQPEVDRNYYLTRAALWAWVAEDFPSTEKWLQRIRDSDFYNGRTLYWIWRAQLKQEKKEAAEQTLSKLLRVHPLSLHTAVALQQTTPDKVLWSEEKTVFDKEPRYPHVNDLISQAKALHENGFHEAAHVLVAWTLDHYPRKQIATSLALLEFASPNSRVIEGANLLMRINPNLTQQALTLAYPVPFWKQFEENASHADPWLLLALSKKESKFDPLAVSSANAKGLMQLIPKTASEVSEKEGSDLFDPHTNIALGTKYLQQLLKENDGSIIGALASYNAGPQAMASWKQRFIFEDCLLFIDLIPYRETRNYISAVLSNYNWYLRLYAPKDLQKWIDLFGCAKSSDKGK